MNAATGEKIRSPQISVLKTSIASRQSLPVYPGWWWVED
jgi:hypothetical protein